MPSCCQNAPSSVTITARLQVRRDPRVGHPASSRASSGRPCALRFARAQLHERGERRIAVAQRPHVGERQVDVRGADEPDAEQRRDPAPDRAQNFHHAGASAPANAACSSDTLARVEPDPISPTRQILPASGPRPAPISMPNSSRSVLAHARLVDARRHRRPRSATTAAPPAAAASSDRSARAWRRAPRGSPGAAPTAPRALPLRSRRALPAARRRAAPRSCGGTSGSARSPRATRRSR